MVNIGIGGSDLVSYIGTCILGYISAVLPLLSPCPGSLHGDRGPEAVQQGWPECPFCVQHRRHAPGQDHCQSGPGIYYVHHCFQGLLLAIQFSWHISLAPPCCCFFHWVKCGWCNCNKPGQQLFEMSTS